MDNVIKEFILNNITEHPSDMTTFTANEFKLSRQTIVNYLTKLIDEGLIIATGNTRARKYKLSNLIDKQFFKKVTPDLQEDVLWRDDILPYVKDLNSNVLDICQYGFTEIMRNVFDHSESDDVIYTIIRNAINVEICILDSGIGIFNKIQRDFDLNDPRHALLELTKGKLTSDPQHHSGEGIFFTSRMFDDFSILSNPLHYIRLSKEDSDWLVESGDSTQEGTMVIMEISLNSKRTIQHIFDEYAPEKGDFGFTKTHIPIELARYKGEQLVSRSQAKRLLARLEQFQEVLLDFEGVEMIGQAFADEIFRVYKLEHPEVKIIWINESPVINKMIIRAIDNLKSSDKELD
ncbi:MAG TPA: ArsR family transcriptional regulator [Dehalococcoidia bacterium]|nr:ArsR family transcriptional regulator [Dehalococcoidia bacterium]